jgi:hypothetical protein
MIRFATLLAQMQRDPTALPRYLAEARPADRVAAQALLAGQRPRKVAGLDALLAWAAEAAGLPDWLVAEALAASGDRAEVAALLLPDPEGAPPGLAEVVAALEGCGTLGAQAVLLDLWSRLPAEARLVVNRLASGTFRTKAPTAPPDLPPGPERVVRAVMTQAAPALREVSLALWRGNDVVPVARLRLDLPEAVEVFAWVQRNMTEKFGPVRTVPPLQHFDLAFRGTRPNPRRKCGLDLLGARILAWVGPATTADPVARLTEGP